MAASPSSIVRAITPRWSVGRSRSDRCRRAHRLQATIGRGLDHGHLDVGAAEVEPEVAETEAPSQEKRRAAAAAMPVAPVTTQPLPARRLTACTTGAGADARPSTGEVV